jgi:hypothetical protein
MPLPTPAAWTVLPPRKSPKGFPLRVLREWPRERTTVSGVVLVGGFAAILEGVPVSTLDSIR